MKRLVLLMFVISFSLVSNLRADDKFGIEININGKTMFEDKTMSTNFYGARGDTTTLFNALNRMNYKFDPQNMKSFGVSFLWRVFENAELSLSMDYNFMSVEVSQTSEYNYIDYPDTIEVNGSHNYTDKTNSRLISFSITPGVSIFLPFKTEKIHPYVSSGISLSTINNRGSVLLAKPYVAADELYIGNDASLKYIKFEGDETLVSLIVGSGFEYSINDNSALDLRIGYMFSLGNSFEQFDEMTDDDEIKRLRGYFEGYDLSGFTFRCGLKSYF